MVFAPSLMNVFALKVGVGKLATIVFLILDVLETVLGHGTAFATQQQQQPTSIALLGKEEFLLALLKKLK